MSKSPNNMSRQGWKGDIIVCHVTEGGFAGSVSWLCNPQAGASTHFVVGADGRSDQLVDLERSAWGNGTGITAGGACDFRRSTNRFVRDRKTNANYYTYSIEHEGYSYKDRFGALTEPQYKASLEVMKQIITFAKSIGVDFVIDREHIIGHYEVTPQEKPNCPAKGGVNFPFDRFIADLRTWRGGATPAPAPAPATPAPAQPASNSNYIVSKTINGYYSSTDAMNRQNPRSTVPAGTYFIFSRANGMLNVTKQKLSAGSWINPADNGGTAPASASAPATYSKPNYQGNSIVDALKMINVASDYANLKRIAIRNGISDFSGTAEQNTKLLNSLKSGTLLKI